MELDFLTSYKLAESNIYTNFSEFHLTIVDWDISYHYYKVFYHSDSSITTLFYSNFINSHSTNVRLCNKCFLKRKKRFKGIDNQ
jgi:hypothetical protein